MHLHDLWFILIATLWVGYFFLEGFDFGVGILYPVLGRDPRDRRLMLNAIGPVWDGNEVWLLVAGGATFAAFPQWYATLFSGFYLPLLLILTSLIVRGVAFEYRGKMESARWRANWDKAIFWCSLVPALLWGVAFGNIVRGVKIDQGAQYVGGFWALLNPYALLGGIVTLGLCTLHGAVFLALKTDGELRAAARRTAFVVWPVVVAAGAAFLSWTQVAHGKTSTAITALACALVLVAAGPALRAGREGWAFLATGVSFALAVVTLFESLYPNVMPSSLNPAWSLTVTNASSTPYTLGVMTWVAGFATPIVLLYQAWTYWIFRKRLRREDLGADSAHEITLPAPREALAGSGSGSGTNTGGATGPAGAPSTGGA